MIVERVALLCTFKVPEFCIILVCVWSLIGFIRAHLNYVWAWFA